MCPAVYTRGQNSKGQLGVGDTAPHVGLNPVVALHGKWVVQVAAALDITLVLTSTLALALPPPPLLLLFGLLLLLSLLLFSFCYCGLTWILCSGR